MITARCIAKNTFFIAFGNIATKIIAFAITVYLARYLGVIDFGKYTFITTYLMMFTFIAGFGLDTVIIRDMAKNIASASKIMSNAITIRLLTSSISILLAIVGIKILDYPADTVFYVCLTAIVLLFQGISYLLESLFQPHLKMHFSAISQISSKLFFGFMIYYIIKHNYGLTQIFIAYIVSELLRAGISFIYSRRIVNYTLKFEPSFCKHLIKQALPFVLGYGLFALYNRFDIIMLAIMQGNESVGFYSAAYRLTESVLFIPSALAATLMPIMAKQTGNDKNKLEFTYNLGTKYIFLILFPITLGAIILGNDIISAIYTKEFGESTYVFQILALTIIFNSLNSLQMSVLVSTNKQQLNNLSVLSCAFLNIALNLVLIPKFSYIGAGIATLLSVICLYSISFYFIYMKLELQPLNLHLLKYIIAAVIMGTVIMYSNLNLLEKVTIGLLVYSFIVFLLKGVNKNDIRFISEK